MLSDIFKEHIDIENNFIHLYSESEHANQKQTNESFSEKSNIIQNIVIHLSPN